MACHPYPYASLPRLSRDEAARLRACLRAWPQDDGRVATEARALLGVEPSVEAGAAELLATDALRPLVARPNVVLWLENEGGAQPQPILAVTPAELAAQLVDRALGGEGDVTLAPGQRLDEVSLGVLGYLCARVLAATSARIRVRDVLDDEARALHALRGEPCLVVPYLVAFGAGAPSTLRVLAPESTLRALALDPPPRSPTNEALRALPLSLCAHAARARLSRRELDALRVGDVVVPSRCALVHETTGFSGQVELHVAGSSRRGFACSAAGTTITVQHPLVAEERIMTEGKRIETQALGQDDPVRLGDDAPIELCITLARFTLPLGQLAALRPGEVLQTGRPIGERASLCAGDRVLAHGELVDVDGDIGLRITALAKG